MKMNILCLGVLACALVACSTSAPATTPIRAPQEPVPEAIEDMVGEWVREHAPEIAEALLREVDQHDLGTKLSGSASLTEKVAAALVVGATIRAEGGASTTIGWEVDVGNELRTVFYGTLPMAMRVAEDRIYAEMDYEGAMLCIRDAADGWVREKCSDG